MELQALAGLIVDADSQNSKISHMNPLTNASNKVISDIERSLKLLLRLFLGVGLGLIILLYSKTIIGLLTKIKYIGEYAEICTYFMSFIFIVLGLTNEKIYKKIPIIGLVYKKLSISISRGSNNFKRIAMFLTYMVRV